MVEANAPSGDTHDLYRIRDVKAGSTIGLQVDRVESRWEGTRGYGGMWGTISTANCDKFLQVVSISGTKSYAGRNDIPDDPVPQADYEAPYTGDYYVKFTRSYGGNDYSYSFRVDITEPGQEGEISLVDFNEQALEPRPTVGETHAISLTR